MPIQYSSFDSAIGHLVIAWSDRGVARLQLFEESAERTVALFQKELPNAAESSPPESLQKTINLLQKHLEGQNQDFRDITIDLGNCGEFRRRVLEATRKVEAGRMVSYGEIARMIGSPAAARAVGRALASNPLPIIVPCHRIIGKNGRLTGFSAPGGCRTKLRLLLMEKGLDSKQNIELLNFRGEE